MHLGATLQAWRRMRQPGILQTRERCLCCLRTCTTDSCQLGCFFMRPSHEVCISYLLLSCNYVATSSSTEVLASQAAGYWCQIGRSLSTQRTCELCPWKAHVLCAMIDMSDADLMSHTNVSHIYTSVTGNLCSASCCVLDRADTVHLDLPSNQ